jgi:hypothetical protein
MGSLTSKLNKAVEGSGFAGGVKVQMEIFTSPGTYTKPASVKNVEVFVVGGGSGGLPGSSTDPRGGWGMQGAYGQGFIQNMPSSPVAVTVGGGGSAPGGAGAASSFGAFVVCEGGKARAVIPSGDLSPLAANTSGPAVLAPPSHRSFAITRPNINEASAPAVTSVSIGQPSPSDEEGPGPYYVAGGSRPSDYRQTTSGNYMGQFDMYLPNATPAQQGVGFGSGGRGGYGSLPFGPGPNPPSYTPGGSGGAGVVVVYGYA